MEFKLIIKKLNNTLSKTEEEIFDTWYHENSAHQKYFNNVKENYSSNITDIDIEKGWQKIFSKIDTSTPRINYWKYAAAILILISSSYFFLTEYSSNQKKNDTYSNITAGSDKATLTLEDGTNIVLNKGEQYVSDLVASNGEELIYNTPSESTSKIAYNYLTVPRGGEYYIKLADGTKVWMNSESKLKYPVSFIKGKERRVELVYGEAYFDVSPSTFHKGSKFIVDTKEQKIEVLGTEFNVRAYLDENNIYTTLVEGKVSINNGESKKILKPTDQSKLNSKTNSFEISTVNVYDEISWKEGIFSFKDKSLLEITRVLSRWYDVEIIFKNEKLKKEEFCGVLKKNQNIADILLTIKNTNFIKHYEINDKKKTITLE